MALVGAQPIPIYYGILYSNPDTIILLHSKDTLTIAQNIQNVFPKRSILFEIENPFDYFYCRTFIENVIKNTKAAKFTFNVSGGTKIMTLAAVNVGKENRIPMFYIDQNNLITDFSNTKPLLFKETIPLGIYFKLFGQSDKSTTLWNTIDKGLFELKDKIFNDFINFKELFKTNRTKNYDETRAFKIENNKYELEWQPNERMCVLYTKSTSLVEKMFDNKVYDVVFNSGWFELAIIEIVAKWPKMKQLYWNTIIPRTDNLSSKNEIDIILDTGVKMFFFECKTNVHDIKDIDKFRNVVKNFGGLSAKGILVTYYEPNKNVMEKCSDNKISVFWLLDRKENELIELLEEEYKIINPI